VARLRLSPPDFPLPPASARHYEGAGVVAIVAGVAALMSAAIGAYSAYASSQAQAGALEYNAALQQQQAAYQQQLSDLEVQMMERQAAGILTMAEAEEQLATQQARAAQTAGEIREAAIRRAYDRTQSDVRAAIGKSGVDTTGSPLLVLMENADTVGQELSVNDYQTALDVAGAKAGGAFAAAEGRMRADALRQELQLRRFGGAAASAASLGQANMLSMQAGNVRTAGMYNVGTSLLGGASAAASPFLRYGRTA
jgi:hypothetical protein